MDKENRVWTGRYWMTNEHTKRISRGLKKYYETHNVWNKNKRLVEIRVTNKTRRANGDYYLKELERNAKNEKKYRSDKKAKRDRILATERANKCGYYGRRDWQDNEISFLKENYEILFIDEMAIELGRSLSSVEHKLHRLKLFYNHKWK